MPPPPGMPLPQTSNYGFPLGLNGFPTIPLPGILQRGPGGQGGQAFPQQAPLGQFRPFGAPGAAVGGPPPGIGGPNVPFGRGFGDAPPGLPHHFSGMGSVTQGGPFGPLSRDSSMAATSGPGAHSRQTSFEQKSFESAANAPSTQPIARPVAAPKHTSSAKPMEPGQEDKSMDVDDITKHLGSSALLDDSDETLPLNSAEAQRPGAAPGLMRGSSNLSNMSNMSAFGASPIFPNPPGQLRMDSFGLPGSSNPSSTWSTPPMPFGQSGSLPGPPSWGSSPTSGWPSGPSTLGSFGMGIGGMSNTGSGQRRPIQIRTNICNACRQFIAGKATNAEGFIEAGTLLRQVQDTVNPPVMIEEMLDFCETEGSAVNGGGNFQILRRAENPLQSLIKYEPEPPSANPPRNVGAGDIGSPSVGTSVPGGPFGSMRGYPFGQLSGQ